MARYEERGESPKKRERREKKLRERRAQNAEYDCRLEEEPDSWLMPVFGSTARLIKPYRVVEDDDD